MNETTNCTYYAPINASGHTLNTNDWLTTVISSPSVNTIKYTSYATSEEIEELKKENKELRKRISILETIIYTFIGEEKAKKFNKEHKD